MTRLRVELYTSDMPGSAYAYTELEGSRPHVGDLWPMPGLAESPRVTHVDKGFGLPILVKLVSKLRDSEVQPAVDRAGWRRRGPNVS